MPSGLPVHVSYSHAVRCFLVATLIGILAGFFCYQARQIVFPGPGDFNWALDTARSLLQGDDPYAFEPSELRIPYPLPVALFGLPLLWAPEPLAAAIFFGCSATLLAWCCLRSCEPWRLLVFLAWPFWYALIFAQWSPLIMASWFIPVLGPVLLLVKPQTALPVVLPRLRSWKQLIPALAVFAVSLLMYPAWPVRWLAMLGDYKNFVPALAWPWGPVVLVLTLVVLVFRCDQHAVLLLGIICLPLRGAYDLCPLWLTVRGPQTGLLLTALSWLPILMPAVGNALGVGGAASWVVPLLLLPTVLVMLWSNIRRYMVRRRWYSLS